MARRREIIPIHEGINNSPEDAYIYGDYKAELRDCIVDIENGRAIINKRPGLGEFCDLSTSASVDGLEWWVAQQKAIIISNGSVWTINNAGGGKTALTGSYFSAGERVIIAEGPTNCYGADGGKINAISTSAVTEMADADAPTTVTHVAFLDQYLLANAVGTRNCHRSDVGDPTSWNSNWFSAEAKYDAIRAIAVENLEVFIWGYNTLEVWYDTGEDSPFSRLEGGYIPSGTRAPYTIKFCGPPVNSFVWLDHHRNLVVLNGRNPKDLSDSLNKFIQAQYFSNLENAAGDYFKVMGHPLYVLHLPTEYETLVYDFKSNLWLKWSYWNSGTSTYSRWRGNCVTYAPSWADLIVGDYANGKAYRMSELQYSDDGNDIRMLIRTPFIDHGDPGATKICNYVEFFVKVTNLSGVSTITLNLRYRDNDNYAWTTAKTITITPSTGQTVFTARVRRLGKYKARQWEIYTTTAAMLAIYAPVEDFEIVYP